MVPLFLSEIFLHQNNRIGRRNGTSVFERDITESVEEMVPLFLSEIFLHQNNRIGRRNGTSVSGGDIFRFLES